MKKRWLQLYKFVDFFDFFEFLFGFDSYSFDIFFFVPNSKKYRTELKRFAEDNSRNRVAAPTYEKHHVLETE